MVIYAGGEGEDLHCMCCCDLCLEHTMARLTGERAPAFTSAELERLVDGVLSQYRLLYRPPDQRVNTLWLCSLWSSSPSLVLLVEQHVEEHGEEKQLGFYGGVVLP
ncbi:hypothetical protein NDU88_005444 [Pleurodeles waltl]|uniref:Uncharacterized protein n=1 Tax=Pleurodeles waltl TaxID=8319 RepID=A0AAV7VMT4_PLEWA|nr:hypothetical protein NDU88_005444 [Pleurodeles waltl]